jgi:hypothetical protein
MEKLFCFTPAERIPLLTETLLHQQSHLILDIHLLFGLSNPDKGDEPPNWGRF